MNPRVHRLGVVLIVLFVALMVNLNYIQVFRAKDLYEDPLNRRYQIATYAQPRGEILSSDLQVLARSEPTDDEYLRRRVYPTRDLFAHTVGYLSFFTAAGLEKSQRARLVGEDAALDRADNLVDYFLGEPQPGSVRVTLDSRVQDTARNALGEQRGAVAALNPKTGAIYALWSTPSFDPNPIASHDLAAADEAAKAISTGDKPGIGRAFAETYAPGSTFKVVTAAAGLKAGVTPQTAFDNPAVLQLPGTEVGLRNFGGGPCRADAGGKVSLQLGFVQSCNTTFAQIGLQVGPDRMREQADLFGFNRSFDIGVETEASVFPPAEEFSGAQSSLAQAAIGQFDVRVTPLQMAMVAAGVANNGVVMKPYLVREAFDGKGRRTDLTRPQTLSQAMSPEHAQVLKGFMVQVVATGTGTAGQVPGIAVGGKTGTAETGPGQAPHAWFTAFAPAEDPVVAVAVVVENGGSFGSDATGGQVAAPVAKELIQTVLTVRPDAGG